jgi:hypothetical protein
MGKPVEEPVGRIEKWQPSQRRKAKEMNEEMRWARAAVKAMLRKLMKNLAEAHERAAVELRKEAAR